MEDRIWTQKLNELGRKKEWGGVCIARAMRGGGNECSQKRPGSVRLILSYYEIKEATSIFELALWKFKLDRSSWARERENLMCECLLLGAEVQSSSSDGIVKRVIGMI